MAKVVYLICLIGLLVLLSERSQAQCLDDDLIRLRAYVDQLHEQAPLHNYFNWIAEVSKAERHYKHTENWTLRAFQTINQIDIERNSNE